MRVTVTGAQAVRRIDAIGNRVFTGPILRETYSSDLREDTASITDWSFVLEGDTGASNQKIEVLGVYYQTLLVRMRNDAGDIRETGGSPWPGGQDAEFLPRPGPVASIAWNIEPSGLKELLMAVHAEFPDLPVMLAENGVGFEDVVTDGELGIVAHDDNRVDYLQ